MVIYFYFISVLRRFLSLHPNSSKAAVGKTSCECNDGFPTAYSFTRVRQSLKNGNAGGFVRTWYITHITDASGIAAAQKYLPKVLFFQLLATAFSFYLDILQEFDYSL